MENTAFPGRAHIPAFTRIGVFQKIFSLIISLPEKTVSNINTIASHLEAIPLKHAKFRIAVRILF